MPARHPNSRHASRPSLWLMTDERMGEGLWTALAALPRGSGVVFRHFATAEPERTALKARIARFARRRRLVLIAAGTTAQQRALHPAHSVREAIAARRAGAALILVSPVYPTRTHPGARALGPLRAATVARAAQIPAIALGGMTAARYRRMKALGFVGWAAIDGLTPNATR
ncbi:thiamine phosphate synthase [Sphingomonas sp. RB3P16]|uniref:thiamine phosphate synthase n=1 Tax=Parasphingomonas frigoris TaxID=3096163 RepID=UPI002FC86E8E